MLFSSIEPSASCFLAAKCSVPTIRALTRPQYIVNWNNIIPANAVSIHIARVENGFFHMLICLSMLSPKVDTMVCSLLSVLRVMEIAIDRLQGHTLAPRLPLPLITSRRGVQLAENGVFEVFLDRLGVCGRGVIVDGESANGGLAGGLDDIGLAWQRAVSVDAGVETGSVVEIYLQQRTISGQRCSEPSVMGIAYQPRSVRKRRSILAFCCCPTQPCSCTHRESSGCEHNFVRSGSAAHPGLDHGKSVTGRYRHAQNRSIQCQRVIVRAD